VRTLFGSILLAILVLGFTSCEPFSSSSTGSDDLKFENASSHTVQVIPLTTEWSGFSLAPGEKRILHNIRDVDFYFEPTATVQEGSASLARSIIFVDAPPSATPTS